MSALATSVGGEEWRTVPGFTDYDVSNLGRVRSRKSGRPKVMLPAPAGGYPRLMLCRDGKAYGRSVHRLVLEAFVGPCPPGMEACHDNGDRSDARLCNLRWDTRKNNHADKRRHGTMRNGVRFDAANHATKISDKEVLEIYRLRGAVPPRLIAQRYRCSAQNASNIQCGRSERIVRILRVLGEQS